MIDPNPKTMTTKKMTNFKTKLGILLALPLYLGMTLVVILLASITWILAKLLNLVGFLDGMSWLIQKTKERLHHIRWMNSLHPTDRQTMKKGKK